MSAANYTRSRVLDYETAVSILHVLEQLQIPIWWNPPDGLLIGAGEYDLTTVLQVRLAHSKPELVELLRAKVVN